MTRLGLIASVVASLAVPAAAQDAYVKMSGAGRDIVTTRIAPDIIQFTVQRDSYVRAINCIAIITNDDVVLFDSATRPSSTAIILQKLRAITAKPVAIVINSHAHPDHWSGTETFQKANPQLAVIASEQTDRFMHLMAPIWAKRIAGQVADKRTAVETEQKTGKLADGTPLPADQLALDRRDLVDLGTLADEFARTKRVFPTIVYKDRLHLAHGGKVFDLTATTGDQDGTTTAYLPDDRVLLTGDVVSYPMPFLSAHPSRQLESLRAIDAMNWAVLIPGHGPAMRDHQFLRLEIALIQSVIDGVAREIAAGDGDVATVQSRVTVDELFVPFTHGDADLGQRYRTRVKDLVKFAFQEMTGSG